MKCPECVAQNKQSIVMIGESTETSMGWQPFYDEDGNYHNHNHNKVTTKYNCTNGHSFSASSNHPCPEGTCTYGENK